MSSTYDYIIIGAGSAGCVIANRLTENPDVRVLLLEAGPRDSKLKLKIPAAFVYNYTSPKFNWMYHTEPDPYMGNRKIFCPRGKVLGGSSSINGMAYVRGHAKDYDNWAAQGLPGWSYAHCLPYFKRMETYSGGEDEYRGGNGPLKITRPKHRHPLYKVFLEAVQQAGYPLVYDTNGAQQAGFGPMDQSIYKGSRSSTSVAYLDSIRHRKNLTVTTGCHATRILLHETHAMGVEFQRSGKLHQRMAEQEVILSAGATNSPQLLMLSGIGSAKELKKQGIPVVVDLPGVGKNLQDHWDFQFQYECTRPISMNSEISSFNRAKNGLRWLLTRGGPAASNHSEVAGYVYGTLTDQPDLQICFMPLAINYDKMEPIAPHGFLLFGMPLRPTSVGRVSLKSADPFEAPSILCNYLSTEKDKLDFRNLIKVCRKIVHQQAFDPVRGKALEPKETVTEHDQIDYFVRNHGKPAHHLCSTCKMGVDNTSVVDEALKVYGVENLRVVDASIMPSITSGNINAPVIMIGEKASDLLAGRKPEKPIYPATS